MARTKRSRRSYGAGEWGRNRVRIFPDPKTGLFQIEWRENGRRLNRSLKHRDWRRAKRQADQFAAGFIDAPDGKAEAKPEPLTLGKLFEIYGEEVTPTKGERSQKYDRSALEMFLRFFGKDRRPATLSQRDWDRFIRARRVGRVGLSGLPVSDRTVERDLRFLLAVPQLGSAVAERGGRASPRLQPSEGLEGAQGEEPDPGCSLSGGVRGPAPGVRRDRLAFSRGARARARDRAPDRRYPPTQVVRRAHGNRGHSVARRARENRVRASDAFDRRGARCLGRGAEGEPPNRRRPPVLPAPRDPARSVGHALVRDWWKRAEALAGLERKRGRGWHSLRRKFASDLMDQPLKVLCELGGWRTAQTVLQRYQRPDEDRLKKALDERRRVHSSRE